MRAAYMHVLADALTSVTALLALTCGMYLGWVWIDPLMGIVGSVVIGVWSYGLVRDSGQVLLDAEEQEERKESIRTFLKKAGEEVNIADLHVWRMSMDSHACIVSLVAHNPKTSTYYKQCLRGISGLDHITVEVNHCCSEHRDQTH